MRLTVVGRAPAYSRQPGSASSCYLVEHEDQALLLDMGQGAFSELVRYRAPQNVNGVLVSHLHADHLVDLIPLRHFLLYEAQAPGSVTLRGPRELRARMDAFQSEDGFLSPLSGDALEPGEFELAGLRVEARHVTHIADSYAFRLTPARAGVGGGGSGLVYSGDCGRADDLLPLLHEGDTLVCEAAFGAGPGGGGVHITAQEAARVAAAAKVGRLVLTHILDRYDAEQARRVAGEAFAGEVLLAAQGLALDIG